MLAALFGILGADMPLYDYQCQNCKKTFEIRHGFDENHAAACEACGGELKRVFNPAPILFKGSGFYVNDSRPKSSSSEAAPSETPASGDAKPAPSETKSDVSKSA